MKEKKVLWPTVSVVIATRNSERTLLMCLSSVRDQIYSSTVEIVIADGGSVDKTIKIAEGFNAKIIHVPKNRQNAEYNKGVAANHATGEVLLMIDHDNILPHKNWLKNMIQPLLDNKEIFGAGVLKFHYDRSMSAVDRYSALLGGTDPVPYFFNKSAHQSYLYDGFHLRARLIEEKKGYFLVKLDPQRLPALGGNGSILRRTLLAKAKSSPEDFFHIDVHVDLAKKGYTTYAFVKDSIIHLTGNNFLPFLRRRRYFIEKYHFEDRIKRRYSIYDPSVDQLALLRFIFYSLSIIFPTMDAIRGYLKKPDLAWFVHPFMCLGILSVYGITTVKEGLECLIGKVKKY